MTRAYEIAVVLNATLTNAEIERLVRSIAESLKKHGAEITGDEAWGIRPLAYPIQKQREGFYQFYTVNLDPAKVMAVETELKLNDGVLRHLVTLVDIEYTEEKAAPAQE
jgi:small subunit ribosomal protein S6